MILVVLTCVLVLLALYNAIEDLYLIYVKKLPPGPLSLPVLGGLYLLNPKQPHLSLEKLYRKYGPIFSLRMGTMGRVIIIMDKDLLNEVLESPYIHDRPILPAFEFVNKGASGIGSCAYGKRWMTITKMFHRGLSKISFSDFEMKATHAYEQLLDLLVTNSKCDDYYPRNDMTRACSAIFSTMIYGTESEHLDSEGLKTRIYYHNMIMSILNPSNPMNIIPILWKLPSPVKQKLEECLQIRDTLFDESFMKHSDKYTGNIEDVMDILVDFEKNNPHKLEEIRRNDLFLSTWTLYLAGCDTTTDVSLWILLYLCVFPDVQEKIREEIDALFDEDIENILEQKHMLNYTRAAILECLRLSSPIALGLPRCTNRDMTFAGYNIPKGTVVMPNQWHLHHDEKLWPNPFELQPERFLDKEGQLFSNNHIFQKMPYMPFSKGKRPCLGQLVALDLLLLFVTQLLKKAIVRLPAGFKPDLSGYVLFNLRPSDFPIQCVER